MSFTTSHRNRNRRNEDSSIYKHSIIRSDGSYIPKNKTDSSPFFRSCCLVTFKKSRRHLPLVTSGYYQDGRSLISSFSRSSKMAAMSNSRPWAKLKCQNPYPGESTLSQFPVSSPLPHPPPPTLGLNIDRCTRRENFSPLLSTFQLLAQTSMTLDNYRCSWWATSTPILSTILFYFYY